MGFFNNFLSNVRRGASDISSRLGQIAGRVRGGISGAIQNISETAATKLARFSPGAAQTALKAGQSVADTVGPSASRESQRGLATPVGPESPSQRQIRESFEQRQAQKTERERRIVSDFEQSRARPSVRPGGGPGVNRNEVAKISQEIQDSLGGINTPADLRLAQARQAEADRQEAIARDPLQSGGSFTTTAGIPGGTQTTTPGLRGSFGVIGGTTGSGAGVGGGGGGSFGEPTEEEIAEFQREKEEGLGAPVVPTVPDAEQIATGAAGEAPELNTSQAVSNNDIRATLANLQGQLVRAKEALANANPIPPDPVEETPAQEDFLDQFEDSQEKFNIREAMDKARADLGIPDLTSQRLELMQDINAINEVFSGAVDEVKNNPNLPKKLALRRISKLQEIHKTRLLQLTGQLEIVGQMLTDANTQLNREFDIIEFEANQEERRRDNARQVLSLMVSSGAVGGLKDSEIGDVASASGVPESVVRAMRDDANKPEVKLMGSVKNGIYKLTTHDDGTVTSELVFKPEAEGGGQTGALGADEEIKTVTRELDDGTVQRITVAENKKTGEQRILNRLPVGSSRTEETKFRELDSFVSRSLGSVENALTREQAEYLVEARAASLNLSLTQDEIDERVVPINLAGPFSSFFGRTQDIPDNIKALLPVRLGGTLGQ